MDMPCNCQFTACPMPEVADFFGERMLDGRWSLIAEPLHLTLLAF
jgi:hypothetical protein